MLSADEVLRRSDERAKVDTVDEPVPPGLLVQLLRAGRRGREEQNVSKTRRWARGIVVPL